jgi:hypothetical protein
MDTVSTLSKEILGKRVIGSNNFVQFTTFSPERPRLDRSSGGSNRPKVMLLHKTII